MRIDALSASIISNPTEQKTILLDHLKKEATVIPMPTASGSAPSGGPEMPGGAPAAPAMQVQDLGKSLIEGHEVEGKRYVLPATQKPQAPAMPQNAEDAESAADAAIAGSSFSTEADGRRGLDQR